MSAESESESESESDPESSLRYRALIQLLRTAEDLWNSSRVFFARWNLSPSQFNVLNLLYARPDGLSQSELSRLLIMHRSNATGLVDRLEQRGLVRRQENSQDRRAYRVVVTPAGIRLLEEIYPHYFSAADQIWGDLPESRVEPLIRELQELAASACSAAGAIQSAPPPPEAEVPTKKGAKPRRPRGSAARKSRGAPPASPEGLRTTDL